MADVFSKKKRSEIMSKIKSKNSKLEIYFRKLLWKNNLRYRIHYKRLVGKPDIAFPKEKVVIFIDSHFWHGYNWSKLKNKMKSDYWQWKIPYNMKRDKKNNKQLRNMGWKVLRFWEHELKDDPNKCIKIIKKSLK